MSDEEEYFNDLVDFSCNEDNNDNSSTSSYEIEIDNLQSPKEINKQFTFNSIFESENKNKPPIKKYGLKNSVQTTPTPETLIIKQYNTKNSKEEKVEEKKVSEPSEKKPETKIEQQYEFDQTFIETFTKGLDSKKIFIKNSKFDDEVKIICLLLKHNYIPEYKCSVSKCRVRKTWNGKPIQLFLFRKNKIDSDLTIDNLELRCPNCYLQEVGLNIFKKKKKESTKSCKICNYPMNGFSFFKQKEAICGLCSSKMSNISFQQTQTQFYNELQETYSSNPKLSDDFKKTEYYKNVGQFKSFGGFNNKNTNMNKNEKTSNIKINVQDIPDIDDIVLE